MNKINILPVLCAICITILFVAIASTGALNPINDWQFLANIFQGREFHAYVEQSTGRFTPLSSQEYAVAARIVEPSATAFYVIHAAKMAVCAILLMVCLSLIGAETWAIISLWAAVFFSIGFAHSSIILQAGELNELLFTLIFIATTLMREHSASISPRLARMAALVGCAALMITCLYKESAFVIPLAFGAVEILRYKAATRKAVPRYVFLLLAIAGFYILFYAIWHGFNFKGSYASTHAVDLWGALSSYAANDLVLVFVALPTMILRTVIIALRPDRITIYDSFLAAAGAYCASFVLLGIYSVYYLLPAYGLAVCGIAGLILHIKWYRLRTSISIAISLLALQNSTAAIADVIYNREISRNYSEFVRSISQWIWLNPTSNGVPRNLVVEGVSAGNAVEVMFSLDYNLNYMGLRKNEFDIIPGDPTDNAVLSKTFDYKSTLGHPGKLGDVVIYNPYQSHPSMPAVLVPSEDGVFESSTYLSMPRWTAWEWVEHCASVRLHCADVIRSHSLYTGYAAKLITRAPERTAAITPISSPSYRVGPLRLPETLRSGKDERVTVLVKNTGNQPWPVSDQLGVPGIVYLSYAWLDQGGEPVLTGERTAFPEEIRAGDSVGMIMDIKTPQKTGAFTLVVSPVQESVKWFYAEPHDSQGAAKSIEIYPSRIKRLLRVAHAD